VAAIAKHGKDDRVYTAWALEYSAVAWLRRGALDQALTQASRSLDIYLQQGLDDVTAKVAELRCDLLLLKGDAAAAGKSLQISRDARRRTGTATEPGFRQGLLLREANLAFAAGQTAQAEALYQQVASATMPAVLRFQRYRLDAGLGIARARLALGDAAASGPAATAVIEQVQATPAPAMFSDRMAEALTLRGSGYAGLRDCSKARRDWDEAAGLLQTFEDPAGYRQRALALSRRACTG
jgi:tetratricopeptide (TPR) repeat protein